MYVSCWLPPLVTICLPSGDTSSANTTLVCCLNSSTNDLARVAVNDSGETGRIPIHAHHHDVSIAGHKLHLPNLDTG